MRTLLLSSVLFAACTTSPADSPYDPSQVVGTWTGKATNNQTTRYTFGADGAFSYGRVTSTGDFQAYVSGTFSFADHDLVLTATVPDESGGSQRMVIQTSAYLGATQFCDAGLRPEPTNDGLIGTWSSTTISQPLDASGGLTGAGTTAIDSLTLDDDGTFTNQNGELGTYTVDGDTVTTSISSGNVSAVRSYTFVDGAALCDPTYTR